MKFIVREGFNLQYTTLQDDGNGGKMAVPAFFPGGKAVDIPEDIAAANLHMLEPVGKDAAAFCEARHVPVTPPASAGIDVDAIAAAASAAMITALVKAGVIKAPDPAAA